MIVIERQENDRGRGTLTITLFVMPSNEGRSENSGNYARRPSYPNSRRSGKYNLSHNRDRRYVVAAFPVYL